MTSLHESLLLAVGLVAGLDAQLVAIVLRSLAVSGLACLLACALGLLFGAWLAVSRFAGRAALLALLNTFLALPSVVVGLLPEAAWGATNVSGRVSSNRDGVSGAKPDPAGKKPFTSTTRWVADIV